MDGISYNKEEIDILIIKDKEYYAKKRKKVYYNTNFYFTVIVIAIAIALIILLKPKEINEIICQYKTDKDNQYINIIKYTENDGFTLIIDDVKCGKEYSHNFEKAGMHDVIFEFKDKLVSLEGFFEGNQYLINADFSGLKTEKIKSMANLFQDCIKLDNITFNIETPNLENIYVL